MVMKITKSLEIRYKLLQEIKRSGDKKPLSALSRGIVSVGGSLNIIINELEESGFIIKIKGNDNTIQTKLTQKGEELLRILGELKAVIDNED